jgi:hypothetical protein
MIDYLVADQADSAIDEKSVNLAPDNGKALARKVPRW